MSFLIQPGSTGPGNLTTNAAAEPLTTTSSPAAGQPGLPLEQNPVYLSAMVSNLLTQIGNSSSQLKATSDENSELRQTNQQLLHKINQLSAKLKTASNENVELIKNNQQISNTNTQLSNLLNATSKENDTLRETNKDLVNKINQLSQDKFELTTKTIQLSSEKTKLLAQVETLNLDNQTHLGTIETLTEDVRKLQQERLIGPANSSTEHQTPSPEDATRPASPYSSRLRSGKNKRKSPDCSPLTPLTKENGINDIDNGSAASNDSPDVSSSKIAPKSRGRKTAVSSQPAALHPNIGANRIYTNEITFRNKQEEAAFRQDWANTKKPRSEQGFLNKCIAYFNRLKNNEDPALEWIETADAGIPGVQGLGVFAKKDIPKDTLLGSYAGIMLPEPDLSSKFNFSFTGISLPETTSSSSSSSTSSKEFYKWSIDAAKKGNMLCCTNADEEDPNVKIAEYYSKEGPRIMFVANRLILKGTQLTIAYGNEYWDGVGITPVSINRKKRKSQPSD